jgi:hypothetical protein
MYQYVNGNTGSPKREVPGNASAEPRTLSHFLIFKFSHYFCPAVPRPMGKKSNLAQNLLTNPGSKFHVSTLCSNN